MARYAAPKTIPKALTNGSSTVAAQVTNGINTIVEGINGAVNGSNGVHAAEVNDVPEEKSVTQPYMFPLSANSDKSLKEIATQLQTWIIETQPEEEALRNLSYTLSVYRSQLAYRSTIVAATREELSEQLKNVDNNKSRAASAPISFVFTGQGAQWNAMGRELFAISNVYAKSIVKSASLIKGFGCSWDLIEELSKDSKITRVGEAELSQPACTAIQVALVDLFTSFGIVPSRVVGHSSGEIAAAYAAGALTHDAAIELAYRRGLSSLDSKKYNSTKGSMMAVGLGEAEVAKYLEATTTGIITVACQNSPSSSTISGDESAIDELGVALEAQGVFNRKLKVDTAYHSHHMKTISQSYLDSCSHITTGRAKDNVVFYSSVTGERKVDGFGPEYWTQNLVSKVRFSDAVKLMRKDVIAAKSSLDPAVFVEIGPHAALAGPLRQVLAHEIETPLKYTYLSALSRGQHAVQTALQAAGKIFDIGSSEVNFAEIANLAGQKDSLKRIVELPAYPWDQTRYWHESRLSKEHRFREFPYHDLCGLKDPVSSMLEPMWRYHVNQDALPWVKDHIVEGIVIFPGSGYICMVVEAMKQLVQMRKTTGTIEKFVFRNLSFSKSIIVPEDKHDGSDPEVELQLSLSPAKNYDNSRWERFRIVSFNKEGVWNEHCSGLVTVDMHNTGAPDDVEGLREIEAEYNDEIRMFNEIKNNSTHLYKAEKFYEDMRNTGNTYGPNFAILDDIYYGDSQGYMEMKVPDISLQMPAKEMRPHTMHPIVLDAINQLSAVLFKQFVYNSPLVPTHTDEFWIAADITTTPGDTLHVAVNQTSESERTSRGDTWVFQKDAEGNMKTVIRAFNGQLRSVGEAVTNEAELPFQEQVGYRMTWDTDSQFLTNDLFAEHMKTTDIDTVLNADGALGEEANGLEFDEVAVRTITIGEQAASLLLRDAMATVDRENIEVTAPHFVKLLSWIRKWNASPEAEAFIAGVGGSDKEADFITYAESGGVEGKMLTKVCRALPEILSGKTDALALMMEDNLLNAFYSNRLVLANYLQMSEYLKLVAFKKPTLKFLEIGAGTGAATLPLLQALTRVDGVQFDRYEYTDISSGFFETARTVFAEWEDYIDYKILDVEQDPIEQGFATESFDVIVCSNVLHATKNMELTMKNVRKLLKPGGKLVLIEVTRLTAANNTIFGCFSGWWASEDGREDSPLLTPEQWDSLCHSTGFSGLQINCPDHNRPTKRTTMMVAEAVAPIEEIKSLPKVQFLAGDNSTGIEALKQTLAPALTAIDGLEVSEASWNTLKDDVDQDSLYIIIDNTINPILDSPSSARFDALQSLVVNGQSILWVSLQEGEGAYVEAKKGLIRGFSRVMRRENGLLKFITVDVQVPWASIDAEMLTYSLVKIAQACFWPASDADKSSELEYGFKDNRVILPRVQKDLKFYDHITKLTRKNDKLETLPYHQEGRPLRLEVGTPGLLNSIHFVDDEVAQKPLPDDEVEVETRAYGVNFKDVFIALGQMEPGVTMVGEACGVVTQVGKDFQHRYKVGDRVTGVGAEPFASRGRMFGNLAYVLPDSISFEVGATIPTCFLTAWYSLVHTARLQKGQSVLIHAASGGVGQAAIQLAQHIGATIYATVGRQSKAQLLIDIYGIPAENIFSTRTRNFRHGIRRATKGKGVNVVLNSLSGETLNDSWECVAMLGYFVEIGKADFYKRSSLAMNPFDKAISFCAVDLVRLFDKQSILLHKYFKEIFDLFEQGAFYPLHPVSPHPMDKIEDAFRLISGRKHTGKVIVSADENTLVKTTAAKPSKVTLLAEGTYVIAGGLGDLGRRIAKWLSSLGAGHIVTLSRRTLDAADQAAFEEELKATGSQLHIVKCDILQDDSVLAAAEYCRSLPPVKGVIHGGMVLRVSLIENNNFCALLM